MLYLTAKSGSQRGVSWPIEQKGLILGRAANCDITISDPMVSRRHCEITLENGQPELRDLQSSNTTLVNGNPVSESRLSVGDEVAIGRTVFLVTSIESMQPRTPGATDADQTVSLKETDSIFMENKVSQLSAQGRPETIQDLAALFSLGRALSTASTYEDLVKTLVHRMVERFAPNSIWIARVIQLPDQFSFIQIPDTPLGGPDTAPNDMLREAVSKSRAQLAPVVKRTRGQRTTEHFMVAPLAVGGEVLAVLAISDGEDRRAFEQSDLEFFMAAAHQAAPFFMTIEQVERLRRDNDRLREAGQQAQLIGASEPFNNMKRLLQNAGQSDLHVLILGETGTGKELAARFIHECSARADGPFIAVNCAAIPQELFESELFGHEKGAFTGADRSHIGRFEQAHRGTLFLDEIGDLSLPNQARILRAIENQVFHRLGAEKETAVDVRIVSATNTPLAQAVRDNKFRSDLYHRLNGFEINLPPLRERSTDIPLLAEYFFKTAQQRAKRPVRSISAEALDHLSTRSWPGNIRELRSCIERAVHMAAADIIQPDDLQLPYESGEGGNGELVSLQEMERHHIALTLERCNWNISAASRILGISRNTLYSKINDYGIEQP